MGRVEGRNSQGWGFVGKGTGTVELVAVEKRDADWMAKLAAESDRYFAANKRYSELTEKAGKEPVDAKEGEAPR